MKDSSPSYIETEYFCRYKIYSTQGNIQALFTTLGKTCNTKTQLLCVLCNVILSFIFIAKKKYFFLCQEHHVSHQKSWVPVIAVSVTAWSGFLLDYLCCLYLSSTSAWTSDQDFAYWSLPARGQPVLIPNLDSAHNLVQVFSFSFLAPMPLQSLSQLSGVLLHHLRHLRQVSDRLIHHNI